MVKAVCGNFKNFREEMEYFPFVHIYKSDYDEKKAFLDAGGDGVWFDGLY